MDEKQVLLQVEHLRQYYRVGEGWFSKGQQVRAVDDVSFSIYKGESFGLVGESGCGKSTTGRAVLRLGGITGGRILFGGQDVASLGREDLRKLRRKMQMIFQDPYASLDPHKTLQQILTEPLRVHGLFTPAERVKKARDMLETVGLTPAYLQRYPHELSGGQRQRIGIARAVILNPDLIVADEPVSALDVSVQAQVINLLLKLQNEFRLTYLFISHDLGVVRHITDRVAVMYLGRIVELAETEELFENPLHPYTRALISAIPAHRPDERKNRVILNGEVPSPAAPPSGCPFHERCPQCMEICKTEAPALGTFEGGHTVTCHLYGGAAAQASEPALENQKEDL